MRSPSSGQDSQPAQRDAFGVGFGKADNGAYRLGGRHQQVVSREIPALRDSQAKRSFWREKIPITRTGGAGGREIRLRARLANSIESPKLLAGSGASAWKAGSLAGRIRCTAESGRSYRADSSCKQNNLRTAGQVFPQTAACSKTQMDGGLAAKDMGSPSPANFSQAAAGETQPCTLQLVIRFPPSALYF